MRTLARSLVPLLLAACGGDSDRPDGGRTVEPAPIAGGGVADAPIDGQLHVHVVEADSETSVASATVTAGDRTAVTDERGLATFTGLSGPQTVTASIAGYAATTWTGVAGANVTLPLQRQQIPTARASGTIVGWEALPAPALGHYTLAVVLYSFLDDPTAPENSIPQPMNGTTPLFTCVHSGLGGAPPCNWQIHARVGKQIHTAVIVDGDAKGTPSDPSDDTHTLIGYAAGDVMTLAPDQTVTGEKLLMVAETQPLAVTFPAAAPGLGTAIAIPELQLADGAGRIVFPLPAVTAARPNAEVLAPLGRFAGRYALVALATPSATVDEPGVVDTPFSTSFVHDSGATTALPAWLAPPQGVSGGGSLSFTASSGAAFHTAQISRGDVPLWNIMLLDDATSLALPALAPDPLGAGAATITVTAGDAPGFDPADFAVPAVKAALVRAAGAQASFTR